MIVTHGQSHLIMASGFKKPRHGYGHSCEPSIVADVYCAMKSQTTGLQGVGLRPSSCSCSVFNPVNQWLRRRPVHLFPCETRSQCSFIFIQCSSQLNAVDSISKPYFFKPFHHCNHRRFHQNLPPAVPRNQRLQPSPRPKLRSRSCENSQVEKPGNLISQVEMIWRKQIAVKLMESDWKLIGNWLESDGWDDPDSCLEYGMGGTTSEHRSKCTAQSDQVMIIKTRNIVVFFPATVI